MVCTTCWTQLVEAAERLPIHLNYTSPGTAVLPYHLELVKRTMHAIKYGKRPDIAVALGRFMARLVPCPDVDLIHPLPLRTDRRYSRGYNQAEQIAVGLQQVWNVPLATNLITRPLTLQNLYSKAQASRSESDRINVYGAYEVPNAQPLSNLRIALIDDTLTTGSTLNAVAEVLQKKTRVAEIIPLTLACSVRLRN